jgi:hypothetical protein
MKLFVIRRPDKLQSFERCQLEFYPKSKEFVLLKTELI